MKLSLGDFFGLGTVAGFQVNNGRLAGVDSPDKVNPPDDAHSVVEANVDLFLRKFDVFRRSACCRLM